MVNDININVKYNGKSQLINCQRHELAKKIAEKLNVNIDDVYLYNVVQNQRRKITPQDIKSLMVIEMIPKRSDKRTLRSDLDNDDNSLQRIENIIQKLNHNSPLTGIERKAVLEILNLYKSLSFPFSKRMKLDETNEQPVVNGVSRKTTEMLHKKVQVNSSINMKESVAQTDPVNLTLDKSSDSEDICYEMKRLGCDNADTEKAMLLMERSFDDRRSFILRKCPTVLQVKEKYVLLFTTAEVKREIDRLNYPGKCAEFLENMEMYAPFILKLCNESDEIVVQTKKVMDRVQTSRQKKYAEVVGSVFALCKVLEEDFRFIQLSDYPHGSDDVYPYIDASCHTLKTLFFDNILYHVYVEGTLLCDAADFPEAVLCLMAGFFIFNIDYPLTCRRTLTAFEKLYLCASDTKEMEEITEQVIKLLQLQATKRKK